eukprot:GHRQ01004376.1.p1 GENE.GHRQ01004376.1~~GHRQ01004376.1.p1  ORF type:complete len:269 (-),score=29.53 GHRQ01004376.1:72-878(-)
MRPGPRLSAVVTAAQLCMLPACCSRQAGSSTKLSIAYLLNMLLPQPLLLQQCCRPGARGGRGEFSWDNVKADKDREYYLGHSVKATTGRWAKGESLVQHSSWQPHSTTHSIDADIIDTRVAALVFQLKEDLLQGCQHGQKQLQVVCCICICAAVSCPVAAMCRQLSVPFEVRCARQSVPAVRKMLHAPALTVTAAEIGPSNTEVLCRTSLLFIAGKDVFWYTKAGGAGGVSSDELQAVKQQERDMMAEVRRRTSSTSAKPCLRGRAAW